MTTAVSREVFDQLQIPSTATLTTVLKKKGLNNTFMHGVAPMGEGMAMAGPAFTLRYIPAREDLNAAEVDNLTDVQRIGIERLERGEVFVIDARGDTTAGTMGNILATRLHARGCAGVVTDGAYRDTPAIVSIGINAYAAAMNAHTNKTSHYPSEIQVPVACGGVAVFPGDIIVGDGEGGWLCRRIWRRRSQPKRLNRRIWRTFSWKRSRGASASSATIRRTKRPWRNFANTNTDAGDRLRSRSDWVHHQQPLEIQQQQRHEGGAFGERVDEDVLVLAVGTAAGHPETVEGGHAQGGGEVAVAAAAGGPFLQLETELAPDFPRSREEAGDRFRALHRGPFHVTGHPQCRAVCDRFGTEDVPFDAVCFRPRPDPHVDLCGRRRRNDVEGRSPFDDADVDGAAPGQVAQACDVEYLVC